MAAADGVRLIDIATEENPALDQPENPDSVLVSDHEDDGNKVIKAGYFMNVERSAAERFDPAKTGGYKKYDFVMDKGRLKMMSSDHASGAIGNDAVEADISKLFGAIIPGSVLNNDSEITDGVIVLTKNNAMHFIVTDLSELTVELKADEDAGVEMLVPNIAIQVTNSVDLTLYVRLRYVGAGPGGSDVVSYLAVADAAGNVLAACASGEVNQVTCVGGCWTQAKFVAAQPSS